MYKLKEKDQVIFFSPAEELVLRPASTKEPEEREFVVGQRRGEVQTREEAMIYVKELDLLVTDMLLEETPAVLSQGEFCEDHGYTYHWISGQKTHLIKKGKRSDCNISNYVPFVVPGLSTSSVQRPLPHHHHPHYRILHLTSTDTSKIQYPKEVEVRLRSYGEIRCINRQKPTTKIKMKDAKKHKAISCMTRRAAGFQRKFGR